MKCVLVIGGSGCVGRMVVEWLLATRPEARVVCLSRGVTELEERDGVVWERGDVLDGETILRVLREHAVTHVLHAAGLRTSDCKADPVRASEVNVGGTVNVLEAVREYGGVERFVFLSTAAVYGVPDGGEFLGERAMTCPLNAYTASKLAAEAMVECYSRDYGIRATILRPQVIYGPERDGGGSTVGVSVALRAASAGRKFTIPFRGRTFFHFTGDVGRFVGRAMLEGEGAFGIYNLPGESLEVGELANEMNRWAGGDLIDCANVVYPFAEGLDDGKFRNDFEGVKVTSFREVLDMMRKASR